MVLRRRGPAQRSAHLRSRALAARARCAAGSRARRRADGRSGHRNAARRRHQVYGPARRCGRLRSPPRWRAFDIATARSRRAIKGWTNSWLSVWRRPEGGAGATSRPSATPLERRAPRDGAQRTSRGWRVGAGHARDHRTPFGKVEESAPGCETTRRPAVTEATRGSQGCADPVDRPDKVQLDRPDGCDPEGFAATMCASPPR